jgi:hypothetical protein
MRNVLGWATALLLAAGASAGAAGAACGDSSTPAPVAPAPLDAGFDAPLDSPAPGPVTLTISPVMANVLTCTSQIFTANVMGPDDKSVSWTVTPPSTGTVDTNGKYTGPVTTPQPPTSTVTATPLADLSVSASATLTLATAFIGKSTPIGGSATTAELASRVGVYPHSVAANGKRTYVVWPSNPTSAATVSMKIARSDDGGTTWNPPRVAITAALKTPQTTTNAWMECPAVTVDPTNPDIVYVVGKITGSSSLAAGVGADDQTTALAVSKDGGATFTTRVLHVGSGDTCPDLTAPAANTIVVEAPAQGDCAAGEPDLRVWSDAANGAGFATGSGTAPYLANGLTLALANVNKAPTCASRIVVAQNGPTGNGGEATEAPRLFTNGKGRLCITYVGSIIPGDGTTTTNAYVQCSDDAGRSFADPVNLDPDRATSIDHSSAVGAFAPDGSVAVLWTNSPDATNQKALLYLAVSKDAGRTFAAPALVPTYVVPGAGAPVPVVNPAVVFDASGILWLTYRSREGGPDRVIVDKSCDEGKTWSGAVLVNGPEASVASNGMKWPALFVTDAAAPSVVASASGALTAFALIP